MKLLAIGLLLFASARAEEPPMLLQGKFGDLCSMCAATLRCEAENASATFYTFHQLTFAGQMRTIFDYVPGLRPATQDRPVTIASDGAPPTEGTATFDRPAARIDLPESSQIDRRSGDWSRDGQRIGRCAIVPRERKKTP